MASTTNYGWTTPDDTALVKDGASAIRSLGTAIDTTVYSNANAAIAKTIVDAKGDLIAATAADSVAKLSVGSNGQVLKANSSTSTGLEWADAGGSGWTLISTGTMSNSTGLTFSSIPTTYKSLRLVYHDIYGTGTLGNTQYMYARFNSDTGSNYGNISIGTTDMSSLYASGGSLQTALGYSQYTPLIAPPVSTSSDPLSNSNGWVEILNSNETTINKFIRWYAAGIGYSRATISGFGVYKGTSAITQIDLIRNGSITYNGTVYLYGM